MMQLATLGLDAEQARVVSGMLSAVETATKAEAKAEVEAGLEVGREKARARWHKWNDKRLQTLANVSKPLAGAEDSSSRLEVSGKKEGEARQRAYRLKADWTLPDEWLQEALAEGMSRVAALASAERMKNWSLSAKDGAKLDWHATWLNWFRRDLAKATAPPDKPKKLTVATMFRDEAREKGVLPYGTTAEIDGRLEASHRDGLAPGTGIAGRFAGAGSG
jgi:hypothetical protein